VFYPRNRTGMAVNWAWDGASLIAAYSPLNFSNLQ